MPFALLGFWKRYRVGMGASGSSNMEGRTTELPLDRVPCAGQANVALMHKESAFAFTTAALALGEAERAADGQRGGVLAQEIVGRLAERPAGLGVAFIPGASGGRGHARSLRPGPAWTPRACSASVLPPC